MINKKIIFRAIGILLVIQAGFQMLSAGVSLYYGEDDILAFILSALVTAGGGALLTFMGREADTRIGRRDGYVIVTFAWLVSSFCGMLPYLISGYIPEITNAFFETLSGFSGTGATILDDIESLPHGLLFWRSLTQWIGGLGIVFFTIAVLPMIGTSGVQLFAAEATGPTHDKLHPRIGTTAKWIWAIYIGLTLTETILLSVSGMGIFDSICHSLTTTATGGYSTKQDSIAYFNSPSIEYIITIFMIISGINFSMLYLLMMKGKIKEFLKDTEVRCYLGFLLAFTIFVTFGLMSTSGYGTEESFRKGVFQVASILTSTGYMSDDYMSWAPFLWGFIGIFMCIGGCAGSTAGGIKCIRISIMWKTARNEFKRIIHPNAVLPVRVSGKTISSTTRTTVLAFIFVYICIFLFGWLALMMMGLGHTEAYSCTVSCLENCGPALGKLGPTATWNCLPAAAKWLCTCLMLMGRLELFSVLMMFTPQFWTKI